MKCTEFENIVNEYIDNEIEDTHIEEHLKTCERCKLLYDETLEIKNLLGDLEVVDLPDDFEETLHVQLLEAKNDMKITPMTSRFKIIGSIAAVAVLSIIAFRAGTLMPLNKESDNAMMATANVAYDMANEETESMDMDEMAIESAVESIEEEAFGMNKTALRMDIPFNYARESITYFLTGEQSVVVEEAWLENFDYKELMYFNKQAEFYVHEIDFEAFNDMIFTNLSIENSVILDNSMFIDDTLNQYYESEDQIAQLDKTLLEASDDDKTEIEENIILEKENLDFLEYDVMNIEHYKGYKKIIIIWED